MPTLVLKSLICSQQQESPGNDEPYIVVNGQTVWETSAMKSKQRKDIDVSVPFETQAEIKLFEKDGVDPDDLFGVQVVSDSPLGERNLSFMDGREG